MIFAVLRNDKDSMDKLRMMKKNIWILMVTAILGFQSCGGSKSIVEIGVFRYIYLMVLAV